MSMQLTFAQKINSRAQRLLPFGLTMILLMFGLTPTYVPGFSQITPMYALVAVYFWSIYRPDLLGYGSGFIIGTVEDLLSGAPLGVGALTLLLTQWTVFNQKKFFYAKPFVVTWFAFAIVAFGASILKWVCVGAIGGGGFTPFGDLFAAYLVTTAAYPVISWIFSKVKVGLLEEL